MAAYKLNKLHLHLAEDEGWRIEIPALPELAEIGSKRCHDPSEATCLLPQLGAGPEGASGVNGYLTTADYVAIVKAAAARQIEVIPSRSEEHTSGLQSLMRISYAVFCLQKKQKSAQSKQLVAPDV